MLDLLKEIYSSYSDMAPYLFIGLFFAGILHLVFKKDFIATHLGKTNFWSVVKAAILGVPLPLCSCGVIPTALYLKKQKASDGATSSFLISTPQTGVDSIIATYGLMGPVFAIFRPIVAFISGIIGGTLIDRVSRKDIQTSNNTTNSCSAERPTPKTLFGKAKEAFRYAFVEFLDDISGHLFIGIVIAGIISFAIPDNFFNTIGSNGFIDFAIMMLLGIPLYVCATSSIPIAVSMMLKGISPGAAFVFLVVGPATNAATITLLLKTLKRKLVVIYLISIAVLAVIGGLVLNWIYNLIGFDILNSHLAEHKSSGLFSQILLVLFSILFILSIYRKIKSKLSSSPKGFEEIEINNNIKNYKIKGMNCNHCVMNVKKAIEDLDGVEEVIVNLAKEKAMIKGDVDKKQVVEAVEEVGYKVGS